MSDDVAPAHPYSPRQPLASHQNGMSKTSRTNTIDSQNQYQGENYAPYASGQGYDRGRADVGEGATEGNESDGIKEYYKAHEKNGAKPRGRKKGSKKTSPGWVEAEKDENNWIHRDKLKEIETKELEEFSMRVGRASRSNSRSQSAARSQSRGQRGRANSELTDNMSNGEDRYDQPRMISPIPAEEEEEEQPHTGWDIRSPAEIEAEREQFAARNNVIRPSTSRIPVAKTSPLPVPPNFVDRDQPLPRPRNGSGNWDSIAANGARVRSGSVSSQMLLDDSNAFGDAGRSPVKANFSMPTSPVDAAPKAKTPAKATPGSRKTSGPKSGSKPRNASIGPRNTSGTSPVKRPGTSGGSISRPTTGHRPEGEAPWIATMYKPDPRLPPDQQIIPTHAKRMQQEQWENEGRVGSMYDKDFRLLNTDELADKRASANLPPLDLEKAQQDQTWPLPSPEKPKMDPIETTTSKSPTNEQGKFKLTPTIPQGPTFPPRAPSRTQEPKVAPPIAPAAPKDTIRLPEPPEPEKEKKSCCCIVM